MWHPVPLIRKKKALLLVAAVAALLLGACGNEDRCSSSGSGISSPATPPPPPLHGTWEGREAPRVLGQPSPSWRIELEYGSSGTMFTGTYATDRAFIEEWIHADTLRGSVSARQCRDEMDIEFELRYPRGSTSPRDYYVHPCTISGSLQGGNWRIDGVLACRNHADENNISRRAIYLIRQDAGAIRTTWIQNGGN